VNGNWLTENADGVITIAPCGHATCGEISGVTPKPDGSMPRDVHGVPECHLRIVRDMVPGDDGRLHGTITDPRDGDVYHAEMWLAPNGGLNLRGYLGIPLLGSTQHWTAYTGKLTPDCHYSKP